MGGVTQRPYQLGDAIHEQGEMAGIAFRVSWQVIEHVRPARVVLRAEVPPARITYTFKARGGNTEFRRELEYDEAVFRAAVPNPGELGRLLLPRRAVVQTLRDLVRKGLRQYLEWSAKLRGQRFYCRSLGGESEYNLTINCDLTLSCNCQDYDGSGHLGDLNKHSFPEVFFGPVAQRFREDLAKGKLPISTCARCGDLARVPKSQSRAVTGLKIVVQSQGRCNSNGWMARSPRSTTRR